MAQQKRHRNYYRDFPLDLRVTAPIHERLLDVCARENKSLAQIGKTLMLLGIGVYDRLAADPRIAKGSVFGKISPRAEVMLLADRQLVNFFLDAIHAEAEATFDEDARRRRTTIARERTQ